MKQNQITSSASYWIDAKTNRPENEQEIIFIDYIGMFKGTFKSHKNGQVFVDGSSKEIIEWDDVAEWIIYPKH